MKTDYFLYNKKADIERWMKNHLPRAHYKLIPHQEYGLTIKVLHSVNLAGQSLNHIPVKFNSIMGGFDVNENHLKSLDFAPFKVEGDFNMGNNRLSNLEGCPKIVKGRFSCINNDIQNLEFCPDFVQGLFFCTRNPMLGEFQHVVNFQIIKQEHERIKNIKKFSQKLKEELELGTQQDIIRKKMKL